MKAAESLGTQAHDRTVRRPEPEAARVNAKDKQPNVKRNINVDTENAFAGQL